MQSARIGVPGASHEVVTLAPQLKGIINVIFLELPKLPEIKEDTDIESLPSAVKWGKFIQEADNPASLSGSQ